jgi:hypothetical protein
MEPEVGDRVFADRCGFSSSMSDFRDDRAFNAACSVALLAATLSADSARFLLANRRTILPLS